MSGPTMDPVLRRLQRRLERLELDHLRQHALDLHEQLEAAREEAMLADESANFWQRHAQDLQEQLYEERPDVTIGLTQAGALVLMPESRVPS